MKKFYFEEIVVHIQHLLLVSIFKRMKSCENCFHLLVSGGQSQIYSDFSSSSLHSSESLSSAINSYQQQSSITDLDETVKSTPLKQLHIAEEIVERYDEGVFEDNVESPMEEDENNSVVVAESDDEDEIAHFDTQDERNSQRIINEDLPIDHQSINLSK